MEVPISPGSSKYTDPTEYMTGVYIMVLLYLAYQQRRHANRVFYWSKGRAAHTLVSLRGTKSV